MPQLHSVHALRLLYLLTVFIHKFTALETEDQITPGPNINPGDPLFLTPLIESGKISQAVEAALVQNFSDIVSYSGFITVNSAFNSNIFFWFFPAEGKQITDNNVPVILWNSRKNGLSCMLSIFGENGPFEETYDEASYTNNQFSWHKRFNMIYMDNPVETGFSFTENEDGYIRSAQDAAGDSYEFLSQFFQLFPHLQKNRFYIGGEFYGSSFALQTANYIHKKNQDGPKIFIKLVGLILGSPWIDPYRQVDYGDYLFNLGLLSESSREYFRQTQDDIRTMIDQNRYLDAYLIFKKMITNDTVRFTGYEALMNVYNDDEVWFNDMTEFVTQNSTRKAIHVGSLKYNWFSYAQKERMQPNMMRSSKLKMETLLQAGYKLLIYVGNMDEVTGHVAIQTLIKSLSWDGASKVLNDKRTIWMEDEFIAGYNMTSNNMTFLIVRGVRHWCLDEETEWMLGAVERFAY